MKQTTFTLDRAWNYTDNTEPSIPPELREIQQEWSDRANAYGDSGSCVIGAGFTFKYKGKNYKMLPCCRWQGSISWEHCYKEIQAKIEALGATGVYFEWGNMD